MTDLEAALRAAIRAERARRNWRQVDLGRRIGLSLSQVSALETGGRAVHISELPRLCRAFGVGLGELLAGADPQELAALRLVPDPRRD